MMVMVGQFVRRVSRSQSSLISNHEAQYAHWSSHSAVEFATDVALRLEVSMVLVSVQ